MNVSLELTLVGMTITTPNELKKMIDNLTIDNDLTIYNLTIYNLIVNMT
jgi:hypothetical protein